MDKMHTVKKSREFANIIHTGKFYKNNCYIIYNKDNGLDDYRFGISVSKKLGNSVHRNLYKRRLRSIIDKYKKDYQKSTDYIIIIRDGFTKSDYSINEKNFKTLIDKINNSK